MSGYLFLAAVGVLWAVLLYNVALTLAGFVYGHRRRRRLEPEPAPSEESPGWPGISILIPARNEARVIERSLRSLLALRYPPDRLEIVVVDDASTDGTGSILDRLSDEDQRVRVIHIHPSIGGRGKAAALNAGLVACSHSLIAVYDADNRPRPDALLRLAAELMNTDYSAAVGRIVKLNRKKTLLNRFSALEFGAFQWSLQAGRAQLFDLVSIPGTNFIIRTQVLRMLGGWDPAALTEDLELSIRLYAAGGRTALVPEAVSEEQDPEKLRPWLRQRMRWMLGNYYVIIKHTGSIVRARNVHALLDLLGLTFTYVLFLAALLVSDVMLIGAVTEAFSVRLAGPYTILWLMAFLLFTMSLQLTQALEGEDDWKTPVVAGLMYISYTQLWLYVALRSLVIYALKGGRLKWDKTPRFQD